MYILRLIILYIYICVYMQVLVDAVEHRAGGNHKVLAVKIAKSPLGEAHHHFPLPSPSLSLFPFFLTIILLLALPPSLYAPSTHQSTVTITIYVYCLCFPVSFLISLLSYQTLLCHHHACTCT